LYDLTDLEMRTKTMKGLLNFSKAWIEFLTVHCSSQKRKLPDSIWLSPMSDWMSENLLTFYSFFLFVLRLLFHMVQNPKVWKDANFKRRNIDELKLG